MFTEIGNILFCVSANPRIGWQKIVRARSLARAFNKFGGNVLFADQRIPGRLRESLVQTGASFVGSTSGPNALDRKSLAGLLSECDPDWLVVDGFEFKTSAMEELSSRRTRMLAFSNPQTTTDSTDIIVSPFPRRADTTKHSETLLAPHYLPLETDSPEQPMQAKRIPVQIRRLGIWLDSDAGFETGLTLRTLQAITAGFKRKLSVDIKCDPNHADFDSIGQLARECHHSIRIHHCSNRMAQLCGQLDLVVVDAGTAAWTCVASGVPTILTAKHDEYSSQLRSPFEFVSAESDTTELAERLREIARDQALRKQKSAAGLASVDGKGANRIARCAGIGNFRFREANLSDIKLLHEWRNDAETRAMNFDTVPIPLDEHARSMNQRIYSPDYDLQIVEDGSGRAIGTCQLAYDGTKNSAELTVLLVPSMRGRQFGTALIERACRKASLQRGISQVTARIRTQHPMAQKAFENAGFTADGLFDVDGRVAASYSYTPHFATVSSYQEQQMGRRQAS